MPRVLVVGLPCSGKTTLSAALAQRLGLERIDMDNYRYEAGWVPRSDFEKVIDDLTSTSAWVAEDWGTPSVWDLLWSRADQVVWLDLPWRQTQWRAIRRTARRLLVREIDGQGNREGLLAWLKPLHPVRFVWSRHDAYRDDLLSRLRDPAWENVHVTRLRTSSEVENYLARS